MGTTPKQRVPKGRQGKHLPEYALKVRELRQRSDLTQPGLGLEIGATRGAIAKWEAAEREPNEENYSKLATVSRRRKLKDLDDFFSSRAFVIIREREHRLDQADLLRFTQAIQSVITTEDLQRVSDLSQIDWKAYMKSQAKRIADAYLKVKKGELKNGELEEQMKDVVQEVFYAKQLSMPGAPEAFRRIGRLEREIRLVREAEAKSEIEGAEARHRVVKQITDGWAIAVLEGKIPDRDQVDKFLEKSNLLMALLAKISGIITDKLIADKEGKLYNDAEFVRNLEGALGGIRESKV